MRRARQAHALQTTHDTVDGPRIPSGAQSNPGTHGMAAAGHNSSGALAVSMREPAVPQPTLARTCRRVRRTPARHHTRSRCAWASSQPRLTITRGQGAGSRIEIVLGLQL